MVGFDSAGELSEETRDPRRTAPRTIIRALGGLRHRRGAHAARHADGRPERHRRSPGRPRRRGSRTACSAGWATCWGRVFLVDVAIAVSGLHAGDPDRHDPDDLLDGPRPGAALLRGAGPGQPADAARRSCRRWSSASGDRAAGAQRAQRQAVFLALTSVCIMLLYIAYLMVTDPAAAPPAARVAGLRGDGRRCSPWAGWGMAVNVVAVVWGLGMAVNLAWPRPEVFGTRVVHAVLPRAACSRPALARGRRCAYRRAGAPGPGAAADDLDPRSVRWRCAA